MTHRSSALQIRTPLPLLRRNGTLVPGSTRELGDLPLRNSFASSCAPKHARNLLDSSWELIHNVTVVDELRGRNATTLQNQTVTARQQYDEPKPRTSRVFLLACLSPRLGYRCRYPAYILGGATEVHATADKTPFAVSQYTLTADDLSKSLTHNSRLRICITIAVLFGSLTVAAQMFITDGYFLGTITVLFGFLCVSFVLFTHRRLAKNYIASLDGDLEVTVEYSNHGISIADSKSELTLEWTAIENTERDASGLFFNLRGGHNIFVPERGLPDNHVLARIEQLIASRTAG